MCAKWICNMQPFMEARVSLEGYTASLCCGSCRKEKPKTKMVRNVFLNEIEITCGLHESLYFFSHKNHHESLSTSRILVLCWTMTQTRLIHYSNLCSSYIGPSRFALLSIARFLSTLRFFVDFFFTIGAKDLFSMAFLLPRASHRSITSLRLSKSGRCRTSTYWPGWFRLTILVGSELLCKGSQIMLCFWHAWLFADSLLYCLVQPCKKKHNLYLSRIVGRISNLCFEDIESSEECIVRLIGHFFGLDQIKPWSIDPMGAIS